MPRRVWKVVKDQPNEVRIAKSEGEKEKEERKKV